ERTPTARDRAPAAPPRAQAEPHPLADEPPDVAVLADAPIAPRPTAPPRRSGADDLPMIPLKPLDDERPRSASATLVDRLKPGLSPLGSWPSGVRPVVPPLRASVARFRPPAGRPPPPIPPNASAAAGAGSAPPLPREPLRAPPPIRELRVLRLAET